VRPFHDGVEEGRSNAAAPPGGIDGQVQDLRLIGSALAPGAESGRRGADQSYQQGKCRVVAERPLGRFGTMMLDTGDRVEIVLGPRSNQNGISGALQTYIVTRIFVVAVVCAICVPNPGPGGLPKPRKSIWQAAGEAPGD